MFKQFRYLKLNLVAALLMVSSSWAADDGPLFERNLSETPKLHTEQAALDIMPLYVLAQNPQGAPPDTPSGEIEYYVGDCSYSDPTGCDIAYSRAEAKPQVATFLDGKVTFIEGLAFIGHGERDAFVDLSLDDGSTWKQYNLSESAGLSSFTLADGSHYPGDVFDVATAVVGNRVLVVWASRYCQGGDPLHTWSGKRRDGMLAAYPVLENEIPVYVDPEDLAYQLYIDDFFGVNGQQLSSDYADEGYPEVGEVPYACLWSARGTLEQVFDDNDDPMYDIVWRAAERITSGVRDVNRVAVTGTTGAGFAVVWQEDPDGLRPGKALCADGGFDGAIAHQGTDIWYSYLSLDQFDDVCLDDPDSDNYCATGGLADLDLEVKPKAAVPMAMPVRLTDNALCKGDPQIATSGVFPYCYADFDKNGTADLCATTESWTNPGNVTLPVCVTEDGRHLVGRTAATRARLDAKPYTNPDGVSSAWVAVIHEEDKALGAETDEDDEPVDIGKNVWYHTFKLDEPELGQQGLMLNAPALDHSSGMPFPTVTDEWEYEVQLTEIARDGRLLLQAITPAMAADSKTSAIVLFKQGILNQGGPADIFLRRLVLPDDFDLAVDNPFAYENVQCVSFDDAGVATPVERFYSDGANPNYVRGLCPVEGMNVSGTTIVLCDDGSSGDACADSFPWIAPEYPDAYPKVTEWVQATDNFNDPSWVNPYDVSRDHRGYLDGDFVMLLYATAPNWNASTIGNEAYNLYARRSFDGGQTWTTLPASFAHINGVTYSGDGTETCEDYGWGGDEEEETCTTYGAGEFEQARNLTRLTGSKVSVLEARFSPTGGLLKTDFTALLCDDEADGIWENCGYTGPPPSATNSNTYTEELRDPSAYFVSYGTGDNTVVTEDSGPEPMNMYYSRALNFGDDYDLIEFIPNGNTKGNKPGGEPIERWDWLAYGLQVRPSDASLMATPTGDRFYAVWSQEDLNRRGDVMGVDAWYRRIFYILEETQ
jgi:hypothetical protein